MSDNYLEDFEDIDDLFPQTPQKQPIKPVKSNESNENLEEFLDEKLSEPENQVFHDIFQRKPLISLSLFRKQHTNL